ncbi:MarR family winged helix-turn-helix transcriptional regulator [Pseudoxanthomonas sp. PXM04]|uniref:MarR family winged helix-turn-helix transcriptional regulator n=1 Tax=Pseudoxanthomonas sp. PXM04 TaxID=2769297 RepID=UPI001782DAEA|nr:MarR family winged helix-turn-helix transcriptional regulator [Pseudoxanthomonas sp. PXM04]MBD9377217.1 winged helix-turn-helix transcriptional regulator [Pseudoxanthomonas sp. PXM04]
MNDPNPNPDAPAAPAPAEPHPHAVLELERFLPYRLSVLSNRVSQTIAHLYDQRFGLAITEWRIMAVLGRFSDLSAGEVAERTAMDKVAVSRAVAKLLERGLIKRDTHGDDRRRSVLALSEVGYSVYDEVAPMTLECERRLLSELSPEETRQLSQLIDKLSDGVAHMTGSTPWKQAD